jgi:phosphatidylinositol alpha-1,6-mannosyltransferase
MKAALGSKNARSVDGRAVNADEVVGDGMSILLISDVFPPTVGGSGRWFWEIYRRLSPARIVVAAGDAPGARAFDAEHDLETERLELSFPTWFLRPRTLMPYARAYRRLRKLIKRHDIARLHAARGAPEGLLALAVRVRTGIRYCCYAHGEEVNLSNREERPRWYRRRVLGSRELASMVYLVLRGAHYVIANSENTRYILTRRWGLPERKVRLLYPGVDTAWFVPAPRDVAVRARLGWSERKVLLTVGRLQKRKGHDVMVRALATVRRRHPDALYSIVGDGDERSHLEQLVDELDLSSHVQFLGEVDEDTLLCCYQQCNLFVLPNREIEGDIEGFGMVLLEAQACGKPVIAGKSGGTMEAMKAPDTGLLVHCHQAEKLAAAVDDLLSDPSRSERMGQAARLWAVEFGWDRLAARAVDLFRATG